MAESAQSYPKFLDWLRFLSAFLLFLYGSSKLLGRQFSLPPDTATKPVGSLTGYELAWFYYGYSHTYAVILGITQLAGATLLLFRKTTLLGAAVLLPVTANIVMINVFFHIAWGALCTSAFIFISTLVILAHERRALLDVFWTQQPAEPENVRRFHRAIAILTVLVAVALMAVGLWLQAASKTSK